MKLNTDDENKKYVLINKSNYNHLIHLRTTHVG